MNSAAMKSTGMQSHLLRPLAVEHEEERSQDDARAGVVLQDDDQQRGADHQPHLEEVAGAVDREVVVAHHAGQGQGRGDLSELHGLHAERAELEPRLGAVDLMSEGQCRQQHHQTQEVGRIGQHVVVAHVEQQHDDGHDPRRTDPDELLHVEVREGEDVGRRVVVGGRGDREPPCDDDQHIEQHRAEIDAVEDRIVPVSGHRPDSRFACS